MTAGRRSPRASRILLHELSASSALRKSHDCAHHRVMCRRATAGYRSNRGRAWSARISSAMSQGLNRRTAEAATN